MTNELDARTLHQLRLMATKFQDDPSTMAWIISTYQKQEKISFFRLSEILRTTETALAKLALCKRPDTSSDEFGRQVEQIADHTKIDLVLLTNLIRQVESVTAFSEKPGTNNSVLQNNVQTSYSAARDKSEELSDDEDNDDRGNKDNVVDE